jgi:Domain of unknown function (DUF4276)
VNSASPTEIVIEIIGEGKTDVSPTEDVIPQRPTSGVVPVLVHRLCDSSDSLRVKRRPFRYLQGKGLWQKAKFVKQNARINGSAGCVFVMDTEGNQEHVLTELVRGRDSIFLDYPMAIGVAHPCIEAWLLADASAVRRGMNLNQRPTVPAKPEELPAPQHDTKNNPKVALAACDPKNRHPNAHEKSSIATHLDLASVEVTCPSFGAFATEVRHHISKLFTTQIPNSIPDESAQQPSEGDATENQ